MNWYFKTVAVPIGLVAYFSFKKESIIKLDPLLAFVILALIVLIGLSIYITYTKESSNAQKYIDAMAAIRGFYRDELKKLEFSDVLIIDELRCAKFKSKRPSRTAFWRSAPLVIINSAIATFAIERISYIFTVNGIGFLTHESLHWLMTLYIVSLISHYVVFKYFYKNYNKD